MDEKTLALRMQKDKLQISALNELTAGFICMSFLHLKIGRCQLCKVCASHIHIWKKYKHASA